MPLNRLRPHSSPQHLPDLRSVTINVSRYMERNARYTQLVLPQRHMLLLHQQLTTPSIMGASRHIPAQVRVFFLKVLRKLAGLIAFCKVGTLHHRAARLGCLESLQCACYPMISVLQLTIKLGMMQVSLARLSPVSGCR